MNIVKEISIPSNTSRENPIEERVKLELGRLSQVTVVFPPGCAGLVGFRILHGEDALIPFNLDEWIIGNGIFFTFPLETEIKRDRQWVKIFLFNEDDYFSHTLYFQFSIATQTLPTTLPLTSPGTLEYELLGGE